MFTWIIGLFTGPLGTIITYLIGGVAIAGVLATLYLTITHNAAREQALKDQNATLTQVLKNQQEYLAKTEQLIQDQQKIADDLNTQIKNIETKNKKLEDYLNDSTTAKEDRPASKILRETIRQLGAK